VNPAEVLLAVPTRGSVHNQTASVLEAVRSRNPSLGPVVFSAGHLSSHETREQIAKYFLATDKQALIMLDDDVVPPLHVLRLTQWFASYDVVGAAVPMFQPQNCTIPQLMAWDYFPEQRSWAVLDDVWGRTSIQACDAIGFGCVAVHRRVFEAMEAPFFPMEYDDEHRTITEDLSFCRAARERGFRVACDFEVACEHFSTVGLLELARGMSDTIKATLVLHGVNLDEPDGRTLEAVK
jgi:Glycosyltransferase like family 2